jgi:hypothetical protein
VSESLGPDTLEARIVVLDACGNAPDALDTLAIPAIATDCERTFSSGRKLRYPFAGHTTQISVLALG